MKNFSIAAVIALIILGISSLFVVQEGQRGIVIQFGKVKRDSNDNTVVYEPGIHFKLPFIEQVKKLDARIQTLDDAPDRFVTGEKKDLMVDSYVKWRISDFATYYLSTGGNKAQAESLLKQKVNNGLRTEFGNRTIQEIVSGERDELMSQAMEAAKSSDDIGISIVDVRVKQINLPLEVSNSIFQRMRAERTAVAKEHRSQGQEKAEIIRADVDARVTVMLADAERKALTLRGEGDANAAKIYAETYSKNPDFYAFIRSLDSYKKSFDSKSDVLIVQPDSDFFRFMKDSKGGK
ncbi:protease modulator HflC [Flocculibacter collagenilyticus]|uniref:protease modulator HflC n=1 Tax=Flocculibacter collagenilyticus TaxID=2744479 RepID=UPI0018F5626A|nr:protease modulator HflC [Flocculibacter collagenilyticus]